MLISADAFNFVCSKRDERAFSMGVINPLNAELNPIRHLLALVGAHHIVHVSRVRVKHVCMMLLQQRRLIFQGFWMVTMKIAVFFM